jgi:hypothetical protein
LTRVSTMEVSCWCCISSCFASLADMLTVSAHASSRRHNRSSTPQNTPPTSIRPPPPPAFRACAQAACWCTARRACRAVRQSS